MTIECASIGNPCALRFIYASEEIQGSNHGTFAGPALSVWIEGRDQPN